MNAAKKTDRFSIFLTLFFYRAVSHDNIGNYIRAAKAK